MYLAAVQTYPEVINQQYIKAMVKIAFRNQQKWQLYQKIWKYVFVQCVNVIYKAKDINSSEHDVWKSGIVWGIPTPIWAGEHFRSSTDVHSPTVSPFIGTDFQERYNTV